MFNNFTIEEIKVGDNTLIVYYAQMCGGLYNKFSSSDGSIENFINNHLEMAFDFAVQRSGENVYRLNITSSDRFSNFKWSEAWAKDLLAEQLRIYFPIIQKFIVDAKAGTLSVLTDTELFTKYGDHFLEKILQENHQ